MNWILVLTITHAIVSLALVIIVLLQQGKQQGLSGAIAGAGETFFGKSKARTIDAMLKKFTTFVAAAFIINSIGLYLVISAEQRPIDNEPGQQQEFEFETEWQVIGQIDADGNILAENEDGEMEVVEGLFINDDGLIEDEEGNILDWLVIDEDNNILAEMPVMPDDIIIDPETGDIDMEEMEAMLREMFGDDFDPSMLEMDVD